MCTTITAYPISLFPSFPRLRHLHLRHVLSCLAVILLIAVDGEEGACAWGWLSGIIRMFFPFPPDHSFAVPVFSYSRSLPLFGVFFFSSLAVCIAPRCKRRCYPVRDRGLLFRPCPPGLPTVEPPVILKSILHVWN